MRLEDIKKRRKILGITQSQLAKLAGVSQSALAKIESGRMNPSFQIAQRIFEALEPLEHEAAVKVSDIMTKRVITIEADEKVERAAEVMKRHTISQLPVVRRGVVVGLVSENTMLEHIGEKNFGKRKVAEVMGESPPTVNENIPIRLASEMLKYNPVLIVTREGKPAGIVAKADLLKVVK